MDLREALAEYAHKSWSGWMRYLFDKSRCNMDGSFIIPRSSGLHWRRRMNTPYADLPESEKESDRKEADKMLAIMEEKGRFLECQK